MSTSRCRNCDKPLWRNATKGYCLDCVAYTAQDRFWAKVNKSTLSGCWEWTGAILKGSKRGLAYGRFKVRHPKVVYAHRYSYEIHFGPIPEDREVMHDCDNTKCVRPEHLRIGTHADNMQDASKKGRLGKKGQLSLALA